MRRGSASCWSRHVQKRLSWLAAFPIATVHQLGPCLLHSCVQAEKNDTYGIRRLTNKSTWEVRCGWAIVVRASMLGTHEQPSINAGCAPVAVHPLQILRMSVTGEALQYFMSAIYTITGAVMGTTPGGDFLAAIEAAQSVGAQVRMT